MFGCGGTPSTIAIGTSDYGNLNIKYEGFKNELWTYKGDPWSGTLETPMSYRMSSKRKKIFSERGYNPETISKITTFIDGKKNGPEYVYNVWSQVVYGGNYKNNWKEGVWKDYWDKEEEDGGKDNPPNLKKEETYKDNKLDGLQKNYNEDGQLRSSRNWEDGIVQGLVKLYYENGQLEEVGRIRSDEIGREYHIGLWKTYHENGQLKSEGNYSEKHADVRYKLGIWKYYNKDGSLEKKEEVKIW